MECTCETSPGWNWRGRDRGFSSEMPKFQGEVPQFFFWITHVTPWFPPSDLSQNIFMDEMDECYLDGMGNDL